VVIAIAWPVAVLGLAVWLAVAILTRFSSLAALVATTAAVVYAGFTVDPARAALIAAIALTIIARHHENIRRLIAGTESRISFKKS
jgi:glycerol-3-phosphate acyltransferase PlsY